MSSNKNVELTSELSNVPSQGSTDTPYEVVYCPECNETMKLSYERRKKTEQLYCSTCQSPFQYKCMTCHKFLKNKKTLRTHKTQTCNKVPNIRCAKCDFTTKRRADLTNHIAIRHSEVILLHKCSKCSRTYKARSDMLRHEKNCANTVWVTV